MITVKTRSFLFRGLIFLLAVLFVLVCAGCMTETEGDTTDGSTETTAPQTTAGINATEPEGAGEGENPLRMMRGATVSLAAQTGLRFQGVVDKDYLDALTAAYGDAVKVGMLFTPTDNLSANSLDFTVEALDACDAITGKKYEKIEVTPEPSDSGPYFANGTLTAIEKSDYGRQYSVVLFVEVGGKILRYSTYSATMNVATLSDVAETALVDLSDTKSGKYRNEFALTPSVTKYSPYTPAQRETLEAFAYPDAITVMSYNIAVYDSPSGGQGWEGRNPAKVSETILSYAPDIIGFQEVNQKLTDGWDATLNALATAGGYTRLTGRYTKDGFEKNEIFYKTDEFTLISESTNTFKQVALDLEVPNTEKADNSLDKHDRVFHYAVLEQKSSGKKFLFVSAHLHYGGTGAGHEADDKVRRYEIKALLAWLERMSAKYPDQIVVGDMNAHYLSGAGKTTMDLYKTGGFSVTRDVAALKGDTDGTLATNNRTTRPEWIFDYVLTKGGVKTAFYTAVNNRVDTNNTYPADHLPVFAKVCLQ